jgi:glycosyltransferase involved in cell wall biosynthesis
VLPTFREDDLPSAIERLGAAVAKLPGWETEIVVVDDSSPDLRAKITAWAGQWCHTEGRPEVKVLEGPHAGKGAAVRVGALASRGDIVFVMDADLPVPLEQISAFMARLEKGGAHVVIGERPMGRNAADPVRFVLSRGLFAFQKFLIFPGASFTDTQCGFKAFRGDIIRQMAAQQVVDGGMYDIEYLFMGYQAGLRIDRVPVTPNPETRPSKINVKRAMLHDPQDLFRVKWRGVTGAYRPVR